jgi:hypothetical protein
VTVVETVGKDNGADRLGISVRTCALSWLSLW